MLRATFGIGPRAYMTRVIIKFGAALCNKKYTLYFN